MMFKRIAYVLTNEESREKLFAAISGIALVISFFYAEKLLLDPAWVAVLLCGWPLVQEAVLGLFTERALKTSMLITLALTAAVSIGEVFAAGEVAFIMCLGEMLEERTTKKAEQGIADLAKLTPMLARVLRDGQEVMLDPQKVAIGDLLRVKPGETIAVDGIIVSGRTAIDQSVVTGEPLPVDKEEGDAVFSGTVNHFGAFDMKALKEGQDSTVQRMICLVEAASAHKAPLVRVMDRWSAWIIIAAVLTALGTWVITGEIIRAVTILVVFCPCSLVLSTPTAIMAGIGRATKMGVLVRSGDALERLATVNRLAFDKTGTLTKGSPEVAALETFSHNYDQNKLLALALTAETRSEHPLGKAVAAYAQSKNIPVVQPTHFAMLPGRGVAAQTNDGLILAGNARLMSEHGIAVSAFALERAGLWQAKGSSIIFLAYSKELVGFLALADVLRPYAAEVIARIRQSGIQTVLLTGDGQGAAEAIGAQCGVDMIQAELRPEQKTQLIREMQESGWKVCMVGDGINDAPALKAARVGLALGNIGSDIAVEAADAVLVNDDLRRIPTLLRLARRTLSTIKANIFMSMGLNFLAVALAATGLMGPVTGALVHNVGALVIILNSTRLLRATKEQPYETSETNEDKITTTLKPVSNFFN